ncbi:18705_t:CDS:1, partial [Gigaspora rosea]
DKQETIKVLGYYNLQNRWFPTEGPLDPSDQKNEKLAGDLCKKKPIL